MAGERWAIGGFNSVLGHPASAYAGDSGYTVSVEGRYALFEGDDSYQFIMRADHGQVFIEEPYLGQDDEQGISGVGIGLMAEPIDSLALRVDWGVPVGEETADDSYVYGQATYRF